MSKIVKNQTTSNITVGDTGVTIPASGQYTIPPVDYLLWAESDDIITSINAGDLILNDGIYDLDSTNSKYFIKYPDEALNVRFLDDAQRSNGFTSKNVQEAIEEARIEVAGKIVTMGFGSTGTTVDKWLFVNHPSMSSYDSPYVATWSGKIIALAYSNSNDSSEIDLEVYINGTLQYTWDIRDKRTSWITSSGGLVSINQGDRISVFAKAVTGTAAKDINGMILVSLITQPNGEGGTTSGL